MNNSPWQIQPERPSMRFGYVELIQEEKTMKNGNPYWIMQFVILPIGDGNTIDRKMYTFNKDWNSVTLPSILGLVNSGELKKPTDINERWVEYSWKEWKDYSKNTREYYQDNDPSKIVSDDKGKPYVEKTALCFTRVFEDQEQAEKEYAALYGGASSVQNDDIPWESKEEEKPDHSMALSFIETWLSANNADGEVDRDALKDFIESNKGMMGELSHDHADVIALVSKFEAEHMEVPA